MAHIGTEPSTMVVINNSWTMVVKHTCTFFSRDGWTNDVTWCNIVRDNSQAQKELCGNLRIRASYVWCCTCWNWEIKSSNIWWSNGPSSPFPCDWFEFHSWWAVWDVNYHLDLDSWIATWATTLPLFLKFLCLYRLDRYCAGQRIACTYLRDIPCCSICLLFCCDTGYSTNIKHSHYFWQYIHIHEIRVRMPEEHNASDFRNAGEKTDSRSLSFCKTKFEKGDYAGHCQHLPVGNQLLDFTKGPWPWQEICYFPAFSTNQYIHIWITKKMYIPLYPKIVWLVSYHMFCCLKIPFDFCWSIPHLLYDSLYD